MLAQKEKGRDAENNSATFHSHISFQNKSLFYFLLCARTTEAKF